jgi:hypothetical protein
VAWARLDDRFHEHRKVKKAWRCSPASVGLHVMAITYCAGHGTDGLVDVEFVEEKVPKDRDRERMIAALVDAGLWELVDGGWVIHDFLEFNPSRAETDEQRTHVSRVRAEAGRRGGLAKAAKHGGNSQVARQQTPSKLPCSNEASSSPDPTRPVNPLEVGSPSTASDDARAGGNGAGHSDEDLAEEASGSLQNALDGLMSGKRGRSPSRQAVLKVLLAHRPSREHVEQAVVQARSIVQSQDESSNIVGLFEMKLVEAMGAAA